MAEIGRLSGLGIRYVSSILVLLRLDPVILATIEKLPAGAGDDVTERWLRPIARLPRSQQLAAVASRLNVGRKQAWGR